MALRLKREAMHSQGADSVAGSVVAIMVALMLPLMLG